MTELKILKLLFDDLTAEYTIRVISLLLKKPYAQTHRNINTLTQKKLIIQTKKGKSNTIKLQFELFNDEFLITEIQRKKDLLNKYLKIKLLCEDIDRIKQKQYICILFGSYANWTAKMNSDIDLLFVIPEEYDYGKFEKNIKNHINVPNVDINITTEEGLIEMWNTPLKLNVGNELLKKHVILKGAEAFLQLRRQYYVG